MWFFLGKDFGSFDQVERLDIISLWALLPHGESLKMKAWLSFVLGLECGEVVAWSVRYKKLSPMLAYELKRCNS